MNGQLVVAERGELSVMKRAAQVERNSAPHLIRLSSSCSLT